MGWAAAPQRPRAGGRLLPWPRTVRGRSTLLGTVVVALALALGATVLLVTLSRSLTRAEDGQARARAAELAEAARDGDLPATVVGIGDDSLAQVVAADGTVLAASSNITGQPRVSDLTPPGPDPTVRTMTGLPDDDETEDYRIWALRTTTPDGSAVVYVGPSLEASQETVARLGRSLLVGLPLLTLLLGLALWLVVGRALRPVADIRRQVGGLSARDLDRRVPVPPGEDEVAALARTMNALLARLEAADRRQRDFVAHASHDLKSPLTAFRAELEVALADPDPDWRTIANALLAESDRMEALVQDLLYLARSEDPAAPPVLRLIDFEDVVGEETRRLRPAPEVHLDVQVTPAPVRGSSEDLARMVRNLLSNAVRHAGSRVEVRLVDDDGPLLTVSDDGPGVPTEHRDRVFDRFFRADPARERSPGVAPGSSAPGSSGTGLGLAIVRSVAESHGGSVRLVGGSTFEVRLPPARPAPAGAVPRWPAGSDAP